MACSSGSPLADEPLAVHEAIKEHQYRGEGAIIAPFFVSVRLGLITENRYLLTILFTGVSLAFLVCCLTYKIYKLLLIK
jgi:hypothetical protein